ncbi:MAG: cobalamin biosynthesis protein CbiX [Paracoccaceae bacterium]|nr:cobalamin biosynthesis protein CbiX [Paracoccaceae bacterium]
MVERTPGNALIVAHGSPSDPEGPEDVMRALARSVASHLPGWSVAGATLAAPGALKAAVAGLGPGCDPGPLLVYPHFMSDGWFVSDELPRRLAAAGSGAHRVVPAFGMDSAVQRLCLERAAEAAVAHPPGSVAVMLAAHGSPSDPRPSAAARAAATVIAGSGRFREVLTGFVDEAPYLAEAARASAPALCLPFFAGRAGHVEGDLPEALAEAEFPGRMLDPIGTDPAVPEIIAAALMRAA